MDSFELIPHPIIVISRIFGAFPVNMKTFNYSKHNLLYTVSLCVLPISLWCAIIAAPKLLPQDSPYIYAIKVFFVAIITLSYMGSKYTCTIASKKNLKPVYIEMKTSYTFLQKAYNFNADKTIRWLSLCALAAYGLAKIPVYLFKISSMILNNFPPIRIFIHICTYWQTLTICCTELQFIFIAFNMYLQFRQINLALADILSKIDEIKYAHLKKISPAGFFFSSNDADSFQGCTPYYNYDNSTRLVRRPGYVYGASDFSSEILNLREAHMHLSEAFFHLNNLFSVQLFLTLGFCFCCILLDINYEIFGYYNGQVTEIPFTMVIRVLGYSLRFFLMILVASHTCSGAKYAGTLVTTMANRFLSKDTKEELSLFSRHVLGSDFEFSAWGFIDVNMGLLTSAIATGSTYLVILFQFQS